MTDIGPILVTAVILAAVIACSFVLRDRSEPGRSRPAARPDPVPPARRPRPVPQPSAAPPRPYESTAGVIVGTPEPPGGDES